VVPLAEALPTLLALRTSPHAQPDGPHLDVEGGLTDARLAAINLTGVAAVRVAGQGSVLLGVSGHQRLARLGVRLLTRTHRPLLALAVNPHQPDRGQTHDARQFLQQVEAWARDNGVNPAIIDVVAGLSVGTARPVPTVEEP
jgi:hypothetical protein